MKKIRCAIYTRKSSEEGLEQEFNSLHAQREACTAYITSQKHEGWELLPEQYDDGGFSGGTMDRPALKALLKEIAAGNVDVIVVYKVDRLTRSLMDFAKIVEHLDKAGVSFVSVTQQFNTTSSMGRLTLNVLLSFAQFEREVTGERIRDKIALSKQKGKWMGGVPPLGYKPVDQKLVIDEGEAKIVRHIFQRYLALQTVNALKEELDADGYRTKISEYGPDKKQGGVPFGKGHLYRILQNRVYMGDIVHKNKAYPGEHAAIIDQEVFEKVQSIVASNRVKKSSALGSKYACLLAGRLFDDKGNYMSPKHSHTRKRHYRYYTSQAIIQGYPYKAGSLPNIPAHEIERLVHAEVGALLKDAKRLQPYLEKETVAKQRQLLATATELDLKSPDEERLFLRSVISKIVVAKEQVTITLCAVKLEEALKGMLTGKAIPETDTPIILVRTIKLTSANNGSKVIIGNGIPGCNAQLVKAIARSYLWSEQLLSGEVNSMMDIARRENVQTSNYISRVLRLRFLAPDIVDAILQGTQPVDLTVEKLFKVKSFDWQDQRRSLGLA